MQAGTECIKILDLATNRQWYYDPKTRCGASPKHYHAESEFITEQTAFGRCKKLSDIATNDIVYVETIDKFYVKNTVTGQFEPGLNVWRKSQVIGPAVYPGKRGESGRRQS